MNEENNVIDNMEENKSTPIKQNNITENHNDINNKKTNYSMFFNVLIFIAVAALYIIHFTSAKKEVIQPVSIKSSLTIAYVDSDTLWENYEFVKDTKKELDDLEMQLNNNYKAQGMAFKAEYDNYLKTGASLTLGEQKKKEAALQQKQQNLMELEKNLGNQILEKKQAKNVELQDSIFAYVKRFNLGPKYSFIMEKSRVSGILFANDSLDITKSILKGLNEAYTRGKNK
jgi:outer membrane protein